MTPPTPLIPRPQEIQPLSGSFIWHKGLKLNTDHHQAALLAFLHQLPSEIQPPLPRQPESCADLSVFQDNSIPREGYRLTLKPGSAIALSASTAEGIFHAYQTLLQLILLHRQPGEREIAIPAVQIEDSPRFRWRGFMLDEARHFHGVQAVKRLLDWMALLKMNVFHWHLSDDQGWRLEIKKYPRLTEIGGRRTASQVGNRLFERIEHKPHSGFYTQAEIAEIVRYAAERHIRIVPEIDLPGHFSAGLAAYPHLGCKGKGYIVQPKWGIFKDILCPGKPGTLVFLKDALAEMIDLFPGEYIHIGGDEAPKTNWRTCPDCQRLAANEGISPVSGLQTWLTNQLCAFLNRNGRKLIGWNEILADNLDPAAACQFWLGDEKTALRHIRNGRKMVLSQFSHYYLDHSYIHSPLDRVYLFEPVFPELGPEYSSNILGIEAPLWTEYAPNQARLDWQLFPRLLAVAETAWLQPEKKNLNSFHQRLKEFNRLLDAKSVGYAKINQANPPAWTRILAPLTLIQPGKGQAQTERS